MDTYIGRQMADAGFQEVLLDRPLHKIVVERRLCDTLVVPNCLVVVCFECRQICNLEEELVC